LNNSSGKAHGCFPNEGKAVWPAPKLILPSTGFGHFSSDPELGYLECKNQGYPNLHQVASSIIIGENQKMFIWKGQGVVLPDCF
jgi:hypothetical protein